MVRGPMLVNGETCAAVCDMSRFHVPLIWPGMGMVKHAAHVPNYCLHFFSLFVLICAASFSLIIIKRMAMVGWMSLLLAVQSSRHDPCRSSKSAILSVGSCTISLTRRHLSSSLPACPSVFSVSPCHLANLHPNRADHGG